NFAATVSRPVRPNTSPRNSILTSAPAANDAVFRRNGIKPNVVRANGHLVHPLGGEGAPEAEATGQDGESSIAGTAAANRSHRAETLRYQRIARAPAGEARRIAYAG
ncbi:MAG TPA: hypothetical protein VGM32_05555, partial [Rhodopila sp.]